MNTYKEKYLKYKNKYIQLKNQLGGKQIILRSIDPDISLAPVDIDFDSGDDIHTLKSQILTQIKNPPELNVDDVLIYDVKADRCSGIKLNGIHQELAELCVKFEKQFDTSKLVPVRIQTGVLYKSKTEITNESGEFIFSNSKFIGEIKSGQIYPGNNIFLRDAIGTFEQPDGNISLGTFKSNKLEGEGRINYANGDYAEGNFKDTKLNGQGKIVFAKSGVIRIGNFVDNQLNGRGQITAPNGTFVSGIFDNNHLVEGKLIGSNGVMLEGSFLNDKLDFGKITEINGNTYEGKIINEKLNGNGIKIIKNDVIMSMKMPDGKYRISRIINGRKVGTIIKSSPVNKFLPNNKIIPSTIIPNSTIYEGEFVNNKLNGTGKITYPDGRVEEGEFSNDILVKPIYKVSQNISSNDLDNYNSFYSNLYSNKDKDNSIV